MKYKIAFKNSVAHDLKKIDKSKVQSILDKIEQEMSENPIQYPILTGKFQGLRKFRIGDYRVIFTVFDDTVLILRISNRKDAYK